MICLGVIVVKAFINTVAQLGNGCTELSCLKLFPSNLLTDCIKMGSAPQEGPA